MRWAAPEIRTISKALTMLLIALFFISCSGNKAISASSSAPIEKIPKIVFLNFSIEKRDNGLRTAKLVSTKTVEGKLKKQDKNIQEIPGNLVFYQLNKGSSVLTKQILENPLKKHIEYIDDSKQFKVALVELDSTLFSLRIQLAPRTKYIALGEVNSPEYLLQSEI